MKVAEWLRLHPGDTATLGPDWPLERILDEYPDHILGFDSEAAQLWGALRLPRDFDTLDRQIAATARIHDLTLVTRRAHAWSGCGVAALDPFTLGPGG